MSSEFVILVKSYNVDDVLVDFERIEWLLLHTNMQNILVNHQHWWHRNNKRNPEM